MKRNDAKSKAPGESLPDKQRRYTYSGVFFERDGQAELSLYKGRLWSVSFIFKDEDDFYNDLLASLRKQYGKEQSEDNALIWSSGSNKIRLEKDSGQIYFSWFDAYVARTMNAVISKERIEDETTRSPSKSQNGYIIPYDEWTEEPGMNTPFPKGGKLIWGLNWGLSSQKAHLLMSSVNRGVFRGSRTQKGAIFQEYSAAVQGKSITVILQFGEKDSLSKITAIFPSKSQKAESLFFSMLSKKLSSPMVRGELKIWYFNDSAFIREPSTGGSVTYSFSPLSR